MNNTRLLELREYNFLKQKDLAKILNVSRPTYSTWEIGLKIIPLKHLNNLANYYDISMDYILGLTAEKRRYKKVNKLNKQVIGNNIRKLRSENNLTLRDLAKVLNTTSSTISAYETGKTLILTAFAIELAKKYHVSIDLLCGKEKI
mgnify:CR=1 FL=1